MANTQKTILTASGADSPKSKPKQQTLPIVPGKPLPVRNVWPGRLAVELAEKYLYPGGSLDIVRVWNELSSGVNSGRLSPEHAFNAVVEVQALVDDHKRRSEKTAHCQSVVQGDLLDFSKR